MIKNKHGRTIHESWPIAVNIDYKLAVQILRGDWNSAINKEVLGGTIIAKVHEQYDLVKEFPFDIGVVYEYYDGKKNRYKIVGHGAGSVIIIERLKHNSRGKAGELMKSNRRKVQRQYNSGELRVVHENELDLDPSSHYDSWDEYYAEARDYVDGGF